MRHLSLLHSSDTTNARIRCQSLNPKSVIVSRPPFKFGDCRGIETVYFEV
jgi:hypothetical protein